MSNLSQGQPAPQTRDEFLAHQSRLRAEKAGRAVLEIRSVFARGIGIEATEQNIAAAVQIYCALLVAESHSP